MQPSATNSENQTGMNIRNDVAFNAYISWRAMGGLIVDEEYNDPESGKVITNKVRQMSLAEFCTTFNVNRTTIWRWKNNTPNLQEQIRARREEIVPLARETVAWNQLFLLGMQTHDKRAAVDALKTYLGHFGELRLPVQRQDIKVQGGLMEVLKAAQDDGIIEGVTVESSNIAGAGEAAPGSLPIPS